MAATAPKFTIKPEHKKDLVSFTQNVEYKQHLTSEKSEGRLDQVKLENDKGNKVWVPKDWLNEVQQ